MDDAERDCTAAIAQLTQRHHWGLLDIGEWTRAAAEHLRCKDAADPSRAAILAYSHALHTACSGRRGLAIQEQGYREIHGYLMATARRQGQIGEDAVQQALQRTYERFEQCRTPGAFLAFALQQLADSARALRREDLRVERAVDKQAAESPPSESPDPVSQLMLAELRGHFEHLAEGFLHAHPRAARQFATLRLKFFDGLDDQTIAERLGVPLRNVYVLRSRAVSKLRNSPEWRALAAEFGILPD